MRGRPTPSAMLDCDALVTGAGIAGLCALYMLRRLGLRVQVCESAPDVGGVWYWNRYPGARFDSESYTYCYSFSEALLQDWDWQERFAAQPEIHAYIRHAADRFDLRRHIRFDTRVTAARYEEKHAAWRVETDRGESILARYLVTAAGVLTVPQLPDIPGAKRFEGQVLHTARWPPEGYELAGKRVGVVGTGATGVQVIQTIAPHVAGLTVYQRTANWCLPQRNAPLGDEERRDIKRRYPQILERCRRSYGGFIHDFDPRAGRELSAEERHEFFEHLWKRPGFAFWLGNFADLMTDEAVNRHACEFLAGKIAERVRDPETAGKLTPRHPFGTKRVPLENGYFEAYNLEHVHLVELRATPIERITARGIVTAGSETPLDAIVFATGFDAITGALDRIDLRGKGGIALRDKWRSGPRTCLGLQVAGFPNLFTIGGPHNAATLCNAVRCIEQNVAWIADCIAYMRAHGYSVVAPTAEAEDEWTRHVREAAEMSLLGTMRDSWFYGANTPGRTPSIAIYPPGAARYREYCDAAAQRGYRGFEFG